MASMMYTYQDLYNQVSKHLGTYGSSGPSGSDLTEAQDYVKSGYLRFLGAYDWTFRRRYTTLSTESGVEVYELPREFGGFRTRPRFSQRSGYPPLEAISEAEWQELRELGEYNSWPLKFCTRAGHYDPTDAQRWEVCFWPTPNAAFTLYYSYYYMPPALSDDTDYPMGGAEMAEAILASCLAAAEQRGDEAAGVQTERSVQLLSDAISLDKSREPSHMGYMGNGSDGLTAWDIARGSTRINNVTYNTD